MNLANINLLLNCGRTSVLIAAISVASLTHADPPSTGDFGRLFPSLPAFQPADDVLVRLAASMRDPNLPVNDNPKRTGSGFTYLGQFLDHDITLDATPLGEAEIPVESMTNGRTPRLDLDSLYGGGQIGNPELYDEQGRFRFSRPNGFEDLQRSPSGAAILPEGRNDENLIVAQIHILFQKFHNRCIDLGCGFSEAQRLTRWHYQWIIVHDFLPEIAGQDTVDKFLIYNGAGKPNVRYSFYKAGNPYRPTIPVEFSVAAYRFGHSMVRLAYVLPTGSVTKTQVFNLAGNDLRGSRPIPPNLKIDFANFFPLEGVATPPGFNISRKIDSLMSAGLFNLPIGPVVPPDPPAVTSLAERNLLRGKRLGLPSYQDVAQAMGIAPYSNAQLGLTDPGLGGKAPLWFGILKESELSENGARLGPTGRQIVVEVILGLLDKDKSSYFSSPQGWSPEGGKFHIADLLAVVNGL
ncbi:MAG: myeloperoxidase, thyroid peroxidase, cyclooxygenase catalytic domain [Chthoniobacteraceae bacterium]|nr:myeloperoxidase, thyroid peroxidase, cyclooxygenase catalytic domain [Chthoniobacteraceae bacterium]